MLCDAVLKLTNNAIHKLTFTAQRHTLSRTRCAHVTPHNYGTTQAQPRDELIARLGLPNTNEAAAVHVLNFLSTAHQAFIDVV